MTSAVAARRTDGIGGRLPRVRSALPAGLIAIPALAPLAFSPGGDVLDTMVLAAAYVVMALGLSVIVGFAGLLDLGYVAFYAIVAYFASGYRGIHVDFLLVLMVAAAAAAARTTRHSMVSRTEQPSRSLSSAQAASDTCGRSSVDRMVLLHGGFPDMKSIRRVVLAVMVVAVALALVAGPAAAKAPTRQFAYTAVIDCGSGPVEVGSGANLWTTLVELETGKTFKPVAWDVSGTGFSVTAARRSDPKAHPVACDYSDGVATGTVTVIVKKA